ncbi:ATP-binding protein [Thioclava sp. F36-7]|uniref:sensor histidine kinase n=1 Tax=Thioclava sp. F36-7 TaxID=1915317 RepID=UPI000997C45A|nr:ATP-binding protein [Thioclava sp. F36-7]OOY08775.1 two-component sensor histidine kinase [Thioclava sp. F36-7]
MSQGAIGQVLDALPSAVLLIGRDERIAQGNVAANRLFGTQFLGRPYVTVLRQPGFGAAVSAALRGARPDPVRLRLHPTGQAETITLVHFSPLPPAPEGPLATNSVLASFEDITALESAEAMRRDFVANVSHELRTPLTALMGFIETLRSSARDDAAARDRFLSIMEREAARMNRLVGDLLSLSRVEGEERMRPTTKVDLALVLKGITQTLEPVAEAASVKLICEGETGALPVQGDPDQLTQVFSNLVENAIKYGGQGGEVRLRVSAIAHEPVLRGKAYRVDVIDRGEGIDEQHLPRITERFYRVDTHRSREKGGTGLGLAIVKHIVARHRGRFRVDSKKGEGSCFTVILPAV